MTDTVTAERSDLYIDVQVYGGSHIPDVIRQMVELANRLQISVWAELNGVRTLARPGDDPAAIIASWDEALTSNYKIASDRRAHTTAADRSDKRMR